MHERTPPQAAGRRKTASMKIPLADDEKELIEKAAQASDAKPVTWARDVLLRAAQEEGITICGYA